MTAELRSLPLRGRPGRTVSAAALLSCGLRCYFFCFRLLMGKPLPKCSNLLRLCQQVTFSAPPLREFSTRYNFFFLPWFFCSAPLREHLSKVSSAPCSWQKEVFTQNSFKKEIYLERGSPGEWCLCQHGKVQPANGAS